MGLHMVALAKLNYLLLSPTHSTTIPLLASLVCPFLLKFSFSFKVVRRAYMDALHSSRLFFFQLHQIAFDTEPTQQLGSGNNNNGGRRWQRALRLVCDRMAHVRRSSSTPTQSDEDSFHALTVLSL